MDGAPVEREPSCVCLSVLSLAHRVIFHEQGSFGLKEAPRRDRFPFACLVPRRGERRSPWRPALGSNGHTQRIGREQLLSEWSIAGQEACSSPESSLFSWTACLQLVWKIGSAPCSTAKDNHLDSSCALCGCRCPGSSVDSAVARLHYRHSPR